MGYALEIKSVTKEFPGVKALDQASFKVKEGEIHALVGENGAGKSTLMKVLSGVYPFGSFDGEIFVGGIKQEFQTINDAEEVGIAIIHQELALARNLTVAENMFLGKERERFGVIRRNDSYKEARKWLEEVGLAGEDPNRITGDLTVGKQQLIEVAKAMSKNAKILILDEPTASLTEQEVEILLDLLRELRDNGVTCIYISHKLEEIFAIADSVTVLRDGETISTDPTSELTEDKIISLMVGRSMEERFPEIEKELGEVMLSLENFSVLNPEERGKNLVEDVSLEVRRGEIVGLAGLMGSGRTELAMGLFGAFGANTSGQVKIEGRETSIASIQEAIDEGIALVSEDRKQYGLVMLMNILENINLVDLEASAKLGVIDRSKTVKKAEHYFDALRIKAPSIETNTGTLSGGNQQKVVLAKWLLTNPKLLILDEPTRGIDVGAKYEIYTLINQLAAEGVAILLISSELPEVIGMSDRILVLNEGRLTGNFKKEEVTQEKIMMAATEGK